MGIFSGVTKTITNKPTIKIPRIRYNYMIKAFDRNGNEIPIARKYFGSGQFRKALTEAATFCNTRLYKITLNNKHLRTYTRYGKHVIREWRRKSSSCDVAWYDYTLIYGNHVQDLNDEYCLTGKMLNDISRFYNINGLFADRPYCYLTKNGNTIIRQRGGFDY